MDFDQIISELKKKQYRRVYFLHGTESYFVDAISNYIEQKVLSEAERAFNQTVLYGKDIDHMAVLDTARRYPMMASHQVVIIKEAQEMRSLDKLQSYIEKPMETTILVICHKHKKLNLNSKFGKALKKHALVFESKGLYDNQVPAWIRTYLKSKKLTITPKAGELIAEYLGTDLAKVANELNKLAINLPAGTEVNDEHIETHIGISKDLSLSFSAPSASAIRSRPTASSIISPPTPRSRPCRCWSGRFMAISASCTCTTPPKTCRKKNY